MKSSLASIRTVPRAVGEEGAALVHSSQLVLQHRELVDLPELLEHRSQVVVLEVARDLSDKELHCVVVLLSTFDLRLLDGQGEGKARGRHGHPRYLSRHEGQAGGSEVH